eukprot:52625-Eustigmatos_ZCMA.PRE.1
MTGVYLGTTCGGTTRKNVLERLACDLAMSFDSQCQVPILYSGVSALIMQACVWRGRAHL